MILKISLLTRTCTKVKKQPTVKCVYKDKVIIVVLLM